MKATILIAGGTGLIGQALTKQLLAADYRVILLTRSMATAQHKFDSHPALEFSVWDVEQGQLDPHLFSKVDHIINLAGAGVADCRWTPQRKKEICESRVAAGQLITERLLSIPNSVKTYLGASAIGWYGPDAVNSMRSFQEDDAPAHDFLGTTCAQWEASTSKLASTSIRRVTLRIGIVLTPAGGALAEFLKPLRLGVATILGDGQQKVSWIHIQDLVAIFLYALETPTMSGVYNAVSPEPVSNKEVIRTLAWARGKFFLPIRVPSWLLQVMMGEMSVEVLKSTTVSAAKILQAGFQFRYPTIRAALASFF
jgi:uncharacterized protein (TIGR01777 family)